MEPKPILEVGKTSIYVLKGKVAGDITRSGADVLVSSAGTAGTMSRGVSRAILDKGGEEIRESLRAHKPLIPGDVLITDAGSLPAKNIYHAVVVNWGEERKVLQATIWRVVTRCIELAQSRGMTSIAFPSLGTGGGQADPFETHSTMAAACLEALGSESSLRRISFCFKYDDTGQTFLSALLQQQVLRQTSRLEVANQAERDQLSDNLETAGSVLLGADAKLDIIIGLLAQLEQNRSARVINNFIVGNIINSEGIAIGAEAQATVIHRGTDQA